MSDPAQQRASDERSEAAPGGLSDGLQRRIAGLETQRDSLARLLEKTDREDLTERYLASIQRIGEEIGSLQEALEYNAWLDDRVSRGPWVEVAITNVEDHNPMDGVHIEIVYEEPGPPADHIEIELTTADPDA